MEKPVYLLLENGKYFEGRSFGAPVEEVTGEVVFTTGMTGYLETLTDPSYYGQIVIQTFPMIGNYGVIPQDFENRQVHLSAYIVKEWCQEPSNFRSSGDLATFFKERGIPAVCGVDTRLLAKTIRECGSMNGKLTGKRPPYAEEELGELKKFRIRDAVRRVTPEAARFVPAAAGEERTMAQPDRFRPAAGEERTTAQTDRLRPAAGENDRETGGPQAPASAGVTERRPLRVVLWDFGAKENILRELAGRGCEVYDVPAGTTAEEILALRPDGVMLSNGPGDPEDNESVIAELKKLTDAKLPLFGICLGHQLLAIAMGAKTGRMKYGHRGANQPVKDLETGRVYISSQNHGYEVLKDSLPEGAEVTFINVNDGTCEGITYRDMPAFTVQFHPEACAGPRDTKELFGRFIKMMEEDRRGGAGANGMTAENKLPKEDASCR